MTRIRLLSEQVANQIAAGEVVERPASVVKELVENALDAGASRVTVEIQAGGRSLIRVTDDGSGMGRDDALLCLERHATSKIRAAEDLAAIQTMGFRGEALPSIASVSRMSLTTREVSSEEGTQVVIHGGRILEVKAAGCAPGTVMEVRSLFFNLPARRKFLRSEETERAHIQHYLTLAALSHPAVAFTFLQDGRPVFQLAAIRHDDRGTSMLTALRDRMRALYGGDVRLLPLDFCGRLDAGPSFDMDLPEEERAPETSDRGEVRVWGYLGAPGVSRATRDEQHLFVNRRPVENRGLNFALLEGYHTALMKGRYPVCCLFLEIDPAAVDVNIHPSKREVKFHQEHAVRRLVAQAVRETLIAFHTPSAEAPAPALPLPPAPAARPIAGTRDTPSAVPDSVPPAPVTRDLPGMQQTVAKAAATGTAPDRSSPNGSAGGSAAVPSRDAVPAAAGQLVSPAPAASATDASAPAAPAAVGDVVPLLHVPLRVVGVVGRLYVVLESDRGLVLLDQHAAHERILFEQMLRRLEQNDAPSQRLLLPETIELASRDASFLREQLAALTRLGVGLSEFGERTFLLDSLPPFVKVSDARRFVLELIDELKAVGAGVNAWRLGEHTVVKTVCRHSVKANDPLAGAELESLVNDLRHCQMPYTCPHGRPTLIEMNFRELEKKFGRSQ